MSLSYLFDPNKQFQDKNGVNNVGGYLYVFINDSDDHAPTYCNFTGTLNPERIVLDNNGRAVVIVDELKTYRIEVYDRSGNMLWSQYPVRPTNVIYGDYNVYNADIYGTPDEIDVDVEMSASGVKKFTIKLANAVKTVIGNIQDTISSIVETVSTKADKVQGAPAGNLASLDANGNLANSGKKAADFKTKQTAITDPTADGTGLSFIDSVTQNANGEITPHKKTVQDGSTVQKGVVRLQDSVGPTESVTDKAVTPHAVRAAIDAAVSSAYHAAGTKTVAQLTSSLLIAANAGDVYNMTDSGTTTADLFVEGAGHPINAGDNVGVCDVGGGVYKFDLLSGFVDLSNYLTKTGDASDTTSTFTKASGDTSTMTSGSKLSAIFTAISNVFASFKALAFKDKASYSDLSSGVQSSLDKADSALQAAVEYVTTSSTWQTLETAYNAGKTLILKVEDGTNWFDEYRLTTVNKSSGSDRFIFCGFPTMVNLEGGSVESLEVTEWICYFDGSTTRWTTTTVDGLELPTKGYVDGKLPASGTTPITKTYAINIDGNASTATTTGNLATIAIEATSSSPVDLNSYNTTSSALGDTGLKVFNWGASSAPYVSNSPFNAAGILYVGGYGVGFTNQWAINRTTGEIYFRYCEYNATNWSGWKKINNMGQVGSLIKPVFIDSNGAAKECDFSVNFGTPVSGAKVLNIVTA